MKISMDTFDYEQGCADDNLLGLVRDHKRTIASSFEEVIGKGKKVEKVSIRGFVKIDNVHLHEASFERNYINGFHAFVLSFFGAVRKEVSFTKNVCGTILVITATVLSFNEPEPSFK